MLWAPTTQGGGHFTFGVLTEVSLFQSTIKGHYNAQILVMQRGFGLARCCSCHFNHAIG
jgi:hypothetical protein